MRPWLLHDRDRLAQRSHNAARGGFRTGLGRRTVSAEVLRPPGQLAPDVLADVVARMRAVPILRVTETVSSGPGSFSPPGTITLSGDAFIATEPYAAGNVEEVWLLPGQPERLAFYLAGSQIFGELELDADRRIRSSRLVTSGHEILHEFSYDVE